MASVFDGYAPRRGFLVCVDSDGCAMDTMDIKHTRCIAALLRQGYDPARVLMVGDAPGDLAAAEKNGVWFYPILVRREAESWARFPEALNALTTGRCPETAPVWREEFRRNLGG